MVLISIISLSQKNYIDKKIKVCILMITVIIRGLLILTFLI